MNANAMKRQRAAFIDRDGVLIRNEVRGGRPYGISDGDPVELIEGVPAACAKLSAAGYLLVMVTNQPDVATGRTSKCFVEETNTYLGRMLGFDDIEVCFHDDAADCDCRKPKAGMIFSAAAKFDIDLPNSVIIGDRWRDIEAGHNAGCRTILIDYHYTDRKAPTPDHVVMSLFEAADWLVNSDKKDDHEPVE